MDLNEAKELADYLNTELEAMGFKQHAGPMVNDLGVQQIEHCEAQVFEAIATLAKKGREPIKYTLRLSQGINPGGANTVQLKIETGGNEPVRAYRSDAGHEPRTHQEILMSAREQILEELRSVFSD